MWGGAVNVCVYAYLHVCSHVCEPTVWRWRCMCAEAWGWPQGMSSSLALHFMYWGRVSYWTQCLLFWPVWPTSLFQAFHLQLPGSGITYGCHIHPAFDVNSGDPIAGLYACSASILPSEPAPQPLKSIFKRYFEPQVIRFGIAIFFSSLFSSWKVRLKINLNWEHEKVLKMDGGYSYPTVKLYPMPQKCMYKSGLEWLGFMCECVYTINKMYLEK